MPYQVKELFFTLQGEGRHTGRAAVFCRFTGCNLWSGREEDRGRGPSCSRWCDTDFVGTDGLGGGRFASPGQLAAAVRAAWTGGDAARPFVVLTGGEPLLQTDEPLVEALHAAGFEVAIETNGTRPPPPGIDWVCVSPKAGTELVLRGGDELKLIFPQPGAEPERFAGLPFTFFYLQPMDGVAVAENSRMAVEYCMGHPQWRLSLQTHKFLGIR
ncbi:MAG TPA: 7-carboxy-7-deazaguanine synthase [Urbifossiella sp.]|jgi:7-carboxy-7-deazaguanine synthase (Cx14CxxC type)|nr:7-carboxy-7-deazaguanine synthase [Urbifossiella sp.]